MKLKTMSGLNKRPCQCENCTRINVDEGILVYEDVGETIFCELKDLWVSKGYLCDEFWPNCW